MIQTPTPAQAEKFVHGTGRSKAADYLPVVLHDDANAAGKWLFTDRGVGRSLVG